MVVKSTTVLTLTLKRVRVPLAVCKCFLVKAKITELFSVDLFSAKELLESTPFLDEMIVGTLPCCGKCLVSFYIAL